MRKSNTILFVVAFLAALVLGHYLRQAWNWFEAEGDKKLILE